MEWVNTIENLIKNTSIVGIISFLITFFNKEYRIYEENQERYFNDFLVKFYDAYRKNNNINIRKFFNKNYSYLDIYIPNYVNYLIEKKEYDKLKKVLIVDYISLYPSSKNRINITFNKIFNRMWFIQYLLIFICIFITSLFVAYLIPISIYEIVGRITKTHYSYINNIPAPIFFMVMLLIPILLILGLKFFLDLSQKNNDWYTYDEKCIKKIIKSKEEQYDKLKNRVYFLKQ